MHCLRGTRAAICQRPHTYTVCLACTQLFVGPHIYVHGLSGPRTAVCQRPHVNRVPVSRTHTHTLTLPPYGICYRSCAIRGGACVVFVSVTWVVCTVPALVRLCLSGRPLPVVPEGDQQLPRVVPLPDRVLGRELPRLLHRRLQVDAVQHRALQVRVRARSRKSAHTRTHTRNHTRTGSTKPLPPLTDVRLPIVPPPAPACACHTHTAHARTPHKHSASTPPPYPTLMPLPGRPWPPLP